MESLRELPLFVVPVKKGFAVDRGDGIVPVIQERKRMTGARGTLLPRLQETSTQRGTLSTLAQTPHKGKKVSNTLSAEGEKRQSNMCVSEKVCRCIGRPILSTHKIPQHSISDDILRVRETRSAHFVPKCGKTHSIDIQNTFEARKLSLTTPRKEVTHILEHKLGNDDDGGNTEHRKKKEKEKKTPQNLTIN